MNINGLSSPARQDILDAFVLSHDIDILLMQEVMHPFTIGFHGYTIHYNIGTSRRGTAIFTRDSQSSYNETLYIKVGGNCDNEISCPSN